MLKPHNVKLLYSLCCMFFLFFPVHAGAYSWEFQGWYGGGAYPSAVFDPLAKNRMYLSSDVAGIWRSENAGDTWKPITEGLGNLNVAFLLPSPSVSNRVYAATEKGPFHSANAGELWQACGDFEGGLSFRRPQSFRVMATDPASPESLFIGTADGKVLFSPDGCRSWSPLGPDARPYGHKEQITSLALTADRNYLMVGSSAGLRRYSFREKRWDSDSRLRQDISDLVSSRLDASVVWAASANQVLVSHDFGGSWAPIEKIGKGKITRLAVHETEHHRLICFLWENGWSGGMELSENDGKSWRRADGNMKAAVESNPTRRWKTDTSGRSLSVSIDPFNLSRIFRTDWWGVWKSTDTGKSWHESIQGSANTVCADLLTLNNGDLLVASMDNGLLRANAGTGAYVPLFPAHGYAPDINGHVWRVLSLDAAGKKLIATSSPWNARINQVILSDDGGKSFRKTLSGLPRTRPRVNTFWGEGYPRALAVDHQNSNNLYLGIDGEDGGGLFMSSDGGTTWAPSPAQPPSRKIYSGLAVDRFHSDIIYYGTCAGIYRSTDRGRSWTHVAPGCIFEILSTEEGALYAVGDHNGPVVLTSTNNGKTWQILKRFTKKGAAKGFSVNPADPAMIAVSVTQWNYRTGGSIHLSLDHGKTWKDISSGLPNGSGAVATAFSKDGKYLYIGRYAGSVYRLTLSTLLM